MPTKAWKAKTPEASGSLRTRCTGVMASKRLSLESSFCCIAGLGGVLSAGEERGDIGHDEPQGVQNRPGDDDPLQPGARLAHAAVIPGKVHHQQGNGGSDHRRNR